MATLTITQTEDYSDGSPPLAGNITSIVFNAPAAATATFGSNQFGPGLISNNVAITGDNSNNTIRVNLSATGTFSAAGWSFTNWSSSDVVVFSDTAGNDTVSGSDFNDRFLTGGGADTLNGRGGDDLFVFDAGDIVAGEVINGGSHTTADGFLIATSGAFDFSVASITAVEELNLVSNGVTVTFGDNQLRAGRIAAVTGNVVQAQAIIVNGNDVDLSGVTFAAWGGANQTISIFGTNSLTNTLIGSSQKETFDNSGSSADTMTGGGGADTMKGRAGADTFVYTAPGDIASGETVDGGADSDTLQIAGAGVYEFGSVALTSIEAITFTNISSPGTFATAKFNANQFGGTGISNSLAITGSAGINHIEVQMTTPGTFTATDWVLSNFGLNGDSIDLNGSAGADTITGTGREDQITGGNGADHILAGSGSDIIRVDSNDIVAGEILDGGFDDDRLNLLSSNATTDVSLAILLSIESLSFNNRANATMIVGGGRSAPVPSQRLSARRGNAFRPSLSMPMATSISPSSRSSAGTAPTRRSRSTAPPRARASLGRVRTITSTAAAAVTPSTAAPGSTRRSISVRARATASTVSATVTSSSPTCAPARLPGATRCAMSRCFGFSMAT